MHRPQKLLRPWSAVTLLGGFRRRSKAITRLRTRHGGVDVSSQFKGGQFDVLLVEILERKSRIDGHVQRQRRQLAPSPESHDVKDVGDHGRQPVRVAMGGVPRRITEDVLQRYSSIGSRLERLYRLLFENTYRADLMDLGYDDIGRFLTLVQERRNAFAKRGLGDVAIFLTLHGLVYRPLR
jgi:hypothetical protein